MSAKEWSSSDRRQGRRDRRAEAASLMDEMHEHALSIEQLNTQIDWLDDVLMDEMHEHAWRDEARRMKERACRDLVAERDDAQNALRQEIEVYRETDAENERLRAQIAVLTEAGGWMREAFAFGGPACEAWDRAVRLADAIERDTQTAALPGDAQAIRTVLAELERAEERLMDEMHEHARAVAERAEARRERDDWREVLTRERDKARAERDGSDRALSTAFTQITAMIEAGTVAQDALTDAAQVMKLLHEAPRAALAPVQPCDQCDPSFGCFDGREPCRKVKPYLASTSSTLICGPDRYVSAQPEERHARSCAADAPHNHALLRKLQAAIAGWELAKGGAE